MSLDFDYLNVDGRLRIWRKAHEAINPSFQQDNCTSHKSRLATGLLDEHSSDFSVLNWSPRSPGINPIEHLWDVLKQGLKGPHTVPTNLTELWIALANIWQGIPVERFQKLVESMPRCVATVIKARTVYFSYLKEKTQAFFKMHVL
ncbi:transposable element Tcb2 transposase [Trichonephila clavipes]|nr:transposable element Tcb2 transposase [Trichonephila clavipes]